MATAKKTGTLEVTQVKKTAVQVCLVGTAPLIYHSIASNFKTSRELLLPKKKEKKSEMERRLKHDPIMEFRESFYTFPKKHRDAGAPTMLSFPSNALKRAMQTATIDMEGASKAAIARLLTVRGHHIPVYGVPELFMTPVRNSGMTAAPDIRTRGILPNWVAIAEIEFVTPHINKKAVTDLLVAAGAMVGFGDWRPEKSGAHGTFELASPDDPEVKHLMDFAKRPAQEAAYWDPTPHDEYSTEMLNWFLEEATERGLSPTLPREQHKQEA